MEKVNKLKECHSKSLDKRCYVGNKYDDNIFINFINLLQLKYQFNADRNIRDKRNYISQSMKYDTIQS